MKKPSIVRVFFLQQKATELCAILYATLEKERMALIHLKTDQILALSTEKEHQIAILKRLRKEMHENLAENFLLESSENFDRCLQSPEKEEWLKLRKAWLEIWDKTAMQIERNQKFMTHSLKNISGLMENLRGLLGQKPTYSAKGNKIEPKMRARRVEGRY